MCKYHNRLNRKSIIENSKWWMIIVVVGRGKREVVCFA